MPKAVQGENSSSAGNASEETDDLGESELRPFYQGVRSEDLPKEEDEKSAKTPKDSSLNSHNDFDIPIVLNSRVEKWLTYFQTRGRRFFASWLRRSGRYIPMMQKILRDNGLPEDLVYLAMIESGFKPYAYSRARASGPWQFIKGTGRIYGLRSNWWIDERRDPEKSTIAAAQHLKDLHDQFNHWYLAAAGYNAGARKVSRAIKRYSTEDFWEMSRFRYLRKETKNYVPKLIAAALIAKNPEKYGFVAINYAAPLSYDKVLVPQPTELKTIASALNLTIGELKELNPELRRSITPPDYPNYELKIPKGHKKAFVKAYPEIRKKAVASVVRHVVKRGETLSDIAQRYGLRYRAIMSFNQLRSTRIRQGQKLAIPRLAAAARVRAATYRPRVSSARNGLYRVRRGDTLWSISRAFEISVSELRKWNKIIDPTKIRPGVRLKIQGDSPESSDTSGDQAKASGYWQTYRIQEGDNLWSIAREHGVPLADLRRWNGMGKRRNRLYPGQMLRIKSVKL